jgi:hypothetical protein
VGGNVERVSLFLEPAELPLAVPALRHALARVPPLGHLGAPDVAGRQGLAMRRPDGPES